MTRAVNSCNHAVIVSLGSPVKISAYYIFWLKKDKTLLKGTLNKFPAWHDGILYPAGIKNAVCNLLVFIFNLGFLFSQLTRLVVNNSIEIFGVQYDYLNH